MAKSEAGKKAQNKYDAANMEMIRIKVNKKLRLKDQLEYAAQKTGKVYTRYIMDALYKQLAADGITVDMLPPLEDASAAPPSGEE